LQRLGPLAEATFCPLEGNGRCGNAVQVEEGLGQ
jgi:hypothetical protein